MGRRWVCEGAHRAGSRENAKDSKGGKEGPCEWHIGREGRTM